MTSSPVSGVEQTLIAASREEQKVHHFRELEGIRALAALAVLLTHVGFVSGATGRQILPGFLARMDFGVALFFVLSGFLLYRPHAAHLATGAARPPLATYAMRRAARLVPAWLLVLAGTLFLVPQSRTAGVVPGPANLTQLQSLRVEWDLPGLAQLWSLSTEVMFYAALPVIALLVARLARPHGPRAHLLALAGVACGSWCFQVLAVTGALPDGFSWLRTLPAMADWFVVGMVLAVCVAEPSLRAAVTGVVRAAPWHLYAVAACVFWVLTTRIAGPYDLTPPTGWQAMSKHLGYAVVAALLIAPSVFGARTRVSTVLSSSVMTYLGAISYGLFLWHLPILLWSRDQLGLRDFGGGFWQSLVVTLGASVAVAALSWHLVEAPSQIWVRGLTGGSVGGRRSPRRRRGNQDEPENA